MSYLYSHRNHWKETQEAFQVCFKEADRKFTLLTCFQSYHNYMYWSRKISMFIYQCTSNVSLSRLEKSQPHHCILRCCDYLQQSWGNGHYTEDKSYPQLTAGTTLSHSLLVVTNLYRYFLFPDGLWKAGWIQRSLEFQNTFPKLPIHSVWVLWKKKKPGNSKAQEENQNKQNFSFRK